MSLVYTSNMYSGITTIICGIAIIVVIFVTQYFVVTDMRYENNVIITDDRLQVLNDAAAPTFLVIIFSLVLSLSGILTLLKSWKKRYTKEISSDARSANFDNKLGLQGTIAKSLTNDFCIKIFWFAIFSYIIIFSLTSNTIVYKPGSSFSHDYGVTIPSFNVIGCCGAPGTFPVITIYVTDELGFLFIPSNIIVGSFLAFLVGINLSIVAYKLWYSRKSCNIVEKEQNEELERGKKNFGILKKRTSAISGSGLLIGLFAGCPACAGNLLLAVFATTAGATMTATAGGLASAAAYSTIGQFQTIFIAVSFIALIAGPYFMSRG